MMVCCKEKLLFFSASIVNEEKIQLYCQYVHMNFSPYTGKGMAKNKDNKSRYINKATKCFTEKQTVV